MWKSILVLFLFSQSALAYRFTKDFQNGFYLQIFITHENRLMDKAIYHHSGSQYPDQYSPCSHLRKSVALHTGWTCGQKVGFDVSHGGLTVLPQI